MTAHFVDLLDALRRRSLRMASLVEDILQEACEALFSADETLANRVMKRDKEVDAQEMEVESEVVRLLALYQPVGSDLRLLCTVLKVNNDLERIADCAVNIAERARHLDVDTVDRQRGELQQMEPSVRRMLRNAIQAYGGDEIDTAQRVRDEDDAVDALYEQIIKGLVADATSSPNNMASWLDVLSVAKNLERIADHATNIAEDVMFLCTGKIFRHGLGRPEDWRSRVR